MTVIFAILNSVVAIIFLGIHVTPRYWCDMYINETALLRRVSSFYSFVCIIKCVFMIYKWKLVLYTYVDFIANSCVDARLIV